MSLRTTDAAPRPGALTLVTVLLAIAVVPGLATAYSPGHDDTGDRVEPDPYYQGNVTIENRYWEPCEGKGIFCLTDDSGTQTNLADSHGFTVNRDDPGRQGHPIAVKPHHIESESAWQSNLSGVDWTDTTEWNQTTVDSNDTFETTTRNGVDVLHFETGAQNNGVEKDFITLHLENPITSDALKHRAMMGLTVTKSGDDLPISIKFQNNNTGGQRGFFVIPPYNVNDDTRYIMNGTGTTFADPKIAGGDKQFGGIGGEINAIQIIVRNGASFTGKTEFYLWGLDLSMKRYEFGADTNGDPVYNMTYSSDLGNKTNLPGQLNLSTWNPNFEYSDVKDIEVSYEQHASNLPASDVSVNDIDSGSFSGAFRYDATFRHPSWIDLTYRGDEQLHHNLEVEGDQYKFVEACGTDVTNKYEGQDPGTHKVLDKNPPVDGSHCRVELETFYTESQWKHISRAGYDVGFAFLDSSAGGWEGLGFAIVDTLALAWNTTAGQIVSMTLGGGLVALRRRRAPA